MLRVTGLGSGEAGTQTQAAEEETPVPDPHDCCDDSATQAQEDTSSG